MYMKYCYFIVELKNLIPTTDGLCGSTCAVVSTHLADVENIDTVVIGGLPGNTSVHLLH